MSRVVCLSTVYMLGIVLAKLNILPLSFSLIGLFLLILMLIADIIFKWKKSFILIFSAFLLAGAILTNLHILSSNYNPLKIFTGKQILIEGTVSSFPEESPDKITFTVKSNNLIYGKGKYNIGSKIKISIKPDITLPEINYADKIKIKGKLSIPQGADSPGGFDYKEYLAHYGISGIVHSSGKGCIKITGKDKKNPVLFASYIIRKKIFNTTSTLLPEPESSLLLGVILGQRFTLPEKLEEAFISTGTLHVLAASGLNVGVLILFCLWIGNLFKLNRKISSAISIPVIIIYTFCAGSSPSIVRASVMGIFALTALILDKEKELTHSIFLSALVILLFNPLWLFDVSFQLSYISVLGIFYLTPTLDKKISILPRFIRLPLAVSLSAQIALYPVIAYYFYRISIISIIANIVIVPIVEFLLPCGLLMNLASIPFKFLGFPIAVINWFLSFLTIKAVYFFDKFPLASIWIGKPALFSIFIYFAILAVLYFLNETSGHKISKPILCLAAMGLIAVYFLTLILPQPLKVTFLNVKDGDSILIQLPTRQNILIDTGYGKSKYGYSKDAAEKYILPYLHFCGINKINLLIITHPHSDHIGGLHTILKNIKVEKIAATSLKSNSLTYKGAFEYIIKNKIRVAFIHSGQTIKLNKNLSIIFLHPPEELLKNTDNDLNNNSIVTMLTYKDAVFLFTGDIEKEAEDYMAKRSLIPKCTVLKIAHQGSKTSSLKKFLAKAKPAYAVISVSSDNKFSHPSKETLRKLKKINSKIYITSIDGTVIFKTNGKKLKIVKSY